MTSPLVMMPLGADVYVGAPMIDYGTEIGMWGADDPEDRMPTAWDRVDTEMRGSYQSVLALRHKYAALRRGDFRALETRDGSQVFAFERSRGDERIVIILNRGNGDATLGNDYLDGLSLVYATDDHASNKRLPALSGAVFAK